MAAGVLWLSTLTGAYFKGHHDADQSAEVARLTTESKTLSASLAEAQRQLTATSAILKASNAREEELAASSQKDRETLEAYAKELAGRSVCELDDADVRRLHQLSAEPGSPSTPLPPARPYELR